MWTHRNPLNCRHKHITHTHVFTILSRVLCLWHTQTLTSPVHFGGFQPASLWKPASFNYKPDHNKGMEQLFPISHGQSGRLQIEDDSYAWLRFSLQSNPPLSPPALCNNSVRENSAPDVHSTLPPRFLSSIVKFVSLSQRKGKPFDWWGEIEIPSLILARKCYS